MVTGQNTISDNAISVMIIRFMNYVISIYSIISIVVSSLAGMDSISSRCALYKNRFQDKNAIKIADIRTVQVAFTY